MEDLRVHGELIESVTIDWTDEKTRDEIMDESEKWIRGRNFLTSRMNGLTEVGDSSLTIDPAD